MIAHFDGFELDVRSAELRDLEGKATQLAEQSFRILVALLERPGEVVGREELCKRLWPNGTIVEFEHSISVAVNRLRQALGDAADSPRFIETLVRRGYRWKTPVQWLQSQHSTSSPQTAARNLVGKRVSHYRILEILGGGGMGLVYKGEDIKLGRRVALKFLPEELASDERALRRFETEARAASALNSPNICTIYAVEEHDGQPFIAMELLEGRTLRDIIAEASSARVPLPVDRVLETGIQIAKGLEAAHQRGIIHRDIKPANVFVTTQGQVKILDFGLAKLHDADLSEPGSVFLDGKLPPKNSSSLTLTRTGVALGTAAYMSPEQVRGEKLDVRTDLFSFGLTLYEMGANRPAFDGETAPILHNAILNETPVSLRILNPGITSKLERTINKAIEKDRTKRYQTSAEVAKDLESVRDNSFWRRTKLWVVGLTGMALVLAGTAFYWQRQQNADRPSSVNLKIHQLTSNSLENPVLDGRISPDGKYLAYVDYKGIHVKTIDKDEVVNLSEPEILKNQNIQWAFGGWSPDSTRLIANAHPANDIEYLSESEADSDLSIWELPIGEGAPRLLRDHAWGDAFSPDGRLISFRTGKSPSGAREIWLMDKDGNNPRKLFGAEAVGGLYWSPDGKRVAYLRDIAPTLNDGDFKGISYAWDRDQIERGTSPIENTPPFDMLATFDSTELPDNRFVFSVGDAGSIGDPTCNFWTVQRHPQTGTIIGKPEQLTHWSGFCMSEVSVSRDAKKLAFLRWSGHPSLHVADLQKGGTHVADKRHFTESESNEQWLDWTADGKSLFFWSNRSGRPAIYRKQLNQNVPEEMIAPSPGDSPTGRLSPDGKWLIYLGHSQSQVTSTTLQMMRVSPNGGPSETVLEAKNVQWWSCSRAPNGLCVLLERSSAGVAIFTRFDSVEGRGPELFRLPFNPNLRNWACALSPTGNRLAVLRKPDNKIEIMSLDGKVLRELPVPQWGYAGMMEWAPDEAGLYIPTLTKKGSSLLYMSLRGKGIRVIRQNLGGNYCPGLPSPDGSHIALVETGLNRNIWMIENF